MNGKYKEKVMDALKGHLENIPPDIKTPCQINPLIEQIIEKCVNETVGIININGANIIDNYKKNEKSNPLDVLINKLKDEAYRIPANNGEGHKIFISFSSMYSKYREIKDIEKKESRKDFSERGRYLLFRTLTAISIAIVVLVASHISSPEGIKLPFRVPVVKIY